MEQQRLFLVIALLFISYLMWDAWQRDFGPKPVTPPAQVSKTASGTAPAADGTSSSEVPVGADSTSVPQGESSSSVPGEKTENAATRQRLIAETDTLRVEIDTRGGDIRKVDLLKYPLKPGEKTPFRLMEDEKDNFFIAQSGFTTKNPRNDGTLIDAPNHTTLFTAEKHHYQLQEGKDSLLVDLSWTSKDGVRFIKSYEFKRDSHLILVRHRVENSANQVWRGNLYQQLQRSPLPERLQQQFLYTYTGGVIYDQEERYQKIDFDDMEDKALKRDITTGWAAMIQHYFVSAWIPQDKVAYTYYTSVPGQDRYVLGMKSADEIHVAANSKQVITNELYVGPKVQEDLEAIAEGLELTVDYGWLTFISKPLFWLLELIHDLVNNWGWSIILLTIMIKLAFYKLSEASYKSMANMRKMQPRMMALKERYGSDRQKMNQALMELYRKEKINPLGGCLPILIQIPVFIALYWVLLESVELRQAGWILWITDLSTRDPYFILPVIMGVSMIIQHRLNPAPMDPIQAKVMMALPLVFTVFFAFFPSGLVLYWVVNNVLSIAQQWYITRIVVKA